MIRKFLMATAGLVAVTGAAAAADLPSRRPPPVFAPVPIFTWSGIYVGGDIGYAFSGKDTFRDSLGGFASASPQGVVGGGHIGYNYQINQFVLGLEGDVSGTNFRNNIASFTTGSVYGVSMPIEASIRGRLGYAWDRALFYATGGAAFGDIKNTVTGGALVPAGVMVNEKTKVGWTVGGGVEYALSNNWSVRGEYRYSDYGHQTDSLLGTGAFVGSHITEHAVRLGFSYKFDMYAPPAPVLAKY